MVRSEYERREEQVGGSTAKKVFLALASVSITTALFILVKVVPTFADVFASFGAKLPWSTSYVVALSGWVQALNNPLGVLEVIGLGCLPVALCWNWRVFGPFAAFLMFLAPLLLLGFTVVALFMPMFELGNAVK